MKEKGKHNVKKRKVKQKHAVIDNFVDGICEVPHERSRNSNFQNGDIVSEKNNKCKILKGDITMNEKSNITIIYNGNVTKNEKSNFVNIHNENIRNSEKSNINHQTATINCDTKNTTDKIIIQEFHQESEEQDLKHEIEDFVSGGENDGFDTSMYCERGKNTSASSEKEMTDISIGSTNTESNSYHENQGKHVRNKIKAGKQKSLSKTNVKESAASNDPLKCDICGVVYKTNIMLNRHKDKHEMESTDSKNPLQCPICKKVYPNWKSLTIHKRKHGAAKDHVCGSCGKGFRTNQELVRHGFVHTNAKSSPCDICGKLFKNKSYAQMHSKLHSAENHKHVCVLCGRHFLRGPDLQKHMRIHTGEKPFICSYCGRLFSESSHLIRHERLHTGDKPYSCEQCDLTFTQKEVLLRHSFTHVKYLPFSCEVCSKGFKTKRELNHHCITHKHSTEPIMMDTCKVYSEILSHDMYLQHQQHCLTRFEYPFGSEKGHRPSHSNQHAIFKHEDGTVSLESHAGLSAKVNPEVISFEVTVDVDPMCSDSSGIVNEGCADSSVELNHPWL